MEIIKSNQGGRVKVYAVNSRSKVSLPNSYSIDRDMLRNEVVNNSKMEKNTFGYDAVIGTTSQVLNGIATYTSIQQAHDELSSGSIIIILVGTYTEDITISKSIFLEGRGRDSLIVGNLIVSGNYNTLRNFKIDGNITLTGNGNHITEVFMGAGHSFSDLGIANSPNIVSE